MRTKGFTAKDEFNAASATALKNANGTTITVKDICVKDNKEGQSVGYLKTDDGIIYGTISSTVIEQLSALAELVEVEPVKVTIIQRKSNAGREYYMLELA